MAMGTPSTQIVVSQCLCALKAELPGETADFRSGAGNAQEVQAIVAENKEAIKYDWYYVKRTH